MKEFEQQDLNNIEVSSVVTAERGTHEYFSEKRRLIEPLATLNDLSMNFYWSWQPEGTEIFRDIDPSLWDKCEQNPRLFLKSASELRLLQKSTDKAYVERLRRFKERFDAYVGESPAPAGKISSQAPIAYFCAEYGVHNSLPTYSGGLGILAGDHLKSASDLNISLVAVGLLYRFGYFRQAIAHDGWQEESYQDVFDSELALSPVTDANGERLYVMIHIRGRKVFAQAWLARVGRISLYLLDTNVEQNPEVDRLITGHLYGGSSETRIVQEKVLGIGGVRLLRRLGVSPSVFHLNEGHSAFLTLELAREHLAENPDGNFIDSIAAVREQCVFTTHTPVSAGNDTFATADLRDCFDAGFIESLKLTEDEFFALGRTDPDNVDEAFGMTPLALRMCRSANGVSEKHGEVSRDLWASMFPGIQDHSAVPITHVTNGVHAPTWVAPLFQELYRNAIGDDWNKALFDPDAWKHEVDNLSDESVWATHLMLKRILIAYLRQRTQRTDTGGQDTINERQDTRKLFSPDVLTIGFARRVAAYKRWNLLLSDLDRLLKLVDHAERPVQFVFAGKAHPQDKTAKQILQQLMSINHDSNWQRRAVFIEDYDQEVARYLVQGVDVWMNVPRRPYEASGTSGMKAAMNGALNFSILDGWWIEGYNGRNGFQIGTLEVDSDEAAMDAADAESLYAVLENEMIPAFYDRDERGLPAAWIARMKNALATLTPRFSSDRMVMEYVQRIYDPQE
jgi:starch phosphorylase